MAEMIFNVAPATFVGMKGRQPSRPGFASTTEAGSTAQSPPAP